MKAKEFLSQGVLLHKEIIEKRERIESLRAIAEGIKVTISDMPKCSNRNLRKMEDMLAQAIDLEAGLLCLNVRLEEVMVEIADVISRIEDSRYRKLLEMRYINFMSWEEIQEKMHYSEPRVFSLHREAIKEVEHKS